MSKNSCKIHKEYKGLEEPKDTKCLACWRFFALMMAAEVEVLTKLINSIGVAGE
jgi:hypothetical protein